MVILPQAAGVTGQAGGLPRPGGRGTPAGEPETGGTAPPRSHPITRQVSRLSVAHGVRLRAVAARAGQADGAATLAAATVARNPSSGGSSYPTLGDAAPVTRTR
jgi:hypothetical protein